MIKCQVPKCSLVINPNGSLAPCCQAHKPFGLGTELMLKDYKNIDSFFTSEFLRDINHKIDEKGEHPALCSECLDQHSNGERTFMDMVDDTLDPKWKIKGKKLKYLEITTSNICNQTCTTCNGWFSSAWNILDRKLMKMYPGIEKELGVENVSRHWIVNSERLQSTELNKIKQALPDINVLCLKGGEPFADKNNIELLEHLTKVNPECYVQIITNFILVGKYIPILKKIKNLDVDASVDGLYNQYEWLRSSKWDKLLEQMDMYTNELGIRTTVNITVSLYNYTNLDEQIKYWDDSPYTRTLSATNIVHHPKISSFKFLTQYYLDYFYDKIPKFTGTVLEKPKSFEHVDREYYLTAIQKWISVMNNVRGIELENCVPAMNQLEEMILDVS